MGSDSESDDCFPFHAIDPVIDPVIDDPVKFSGGFVYKPVPEKFDQTFGLDFNYRNLKEVLFTPDGPPQNMSTR